MQSPRFSRLLFVLLLSVSALAACKDHVPADVMDEPTMTAFLKEAYLLEGFYAIETSFRYETMTPEIVASYDSLLAKYGITREDFERSVEYYMHHTDKYVDIHNAVIAQLDEEIRQ